MENNCFLQKYLEDGGNPSLPVVNTLFFDYVGYDKQDAATTQISILIEAGETPVQFETKQAMHKDGISGELVTSGTLNANQSITLENYASVLGTTAISEFLKISGGIYNLVRCAAYGAPNYPAATFSGINFTPSTRNGINGLRYNQDIICYGGYNVKDEAIPASTRWLVLGSSETDIINIDFIPEGVQVIACSKIKGTSATNAVYLTNATKTKEIRVFNARVYNNIADLPYNTRALNMSGSGAAGALEDFVAAARAAGRTSGCLAIIYPDASWNITIGGVALKNAGVTKVGSYAYLTWTANSISWANSQPEGMAQYTTSLASMRMFVPFED